MTSVVEGKPVDAADFEPRKLAHTGHLGPDPAAAFRSAAERAVSVFARPGWLEGRFAYPAPDMPGQVLASLCLLDSLVHGWDIARGAGVGYRPDDAVVAAVRGFTAAAIGDRERERGLFGPALPTGPDTDPFTATLAHLGRRPDRPICTPRRAPCGTSMPHALPTGTHTRTDHPWRTTEGSPPASGT